MLFVKFFYFRIFNGKANIIQLFDLGFNTICFLISNKILKTSPFLEPVFSFYFLGNRNSSPPVNYCGENCVAIFSCTMSRALSEV